MATVKKSEKFFVVYPSGWTGLEEASFDTIEGVQDYIADLIEENAIEDVEADLGVYRGVTFNVEVKKSIILKEVK